MKLSTDVCAIIAAAGSGVRAGLGYNKMLWRSEGVTLIRRTAQKFAHLNKVIVACNPAERSHIQELLADIPNVVLCDGGETRTQSVRNALKFVTCPITLIHDGARPFVTEELISRCAYEAEKYGNAIPCVLSDVAIKQKLNSEITSVDRNNIYFVQTPQAFKSDLIKTAYNQIDGNYADDSEVLEKYGEKIHIIDGECGNIKLTHPEQFLKTDRLRIGTGYDVHQLSPERKLILGGVEIEFDKGLMGHSDADVLTHAIMDALLSAAGLPDIGVQFPVDDKSLDGISSMILLDRVMNKIDGYSVINVSAVIMAQKPKLADVIPLMREKLADAIGISFENVNISATTTEKLGIVGEGRGMAASATVLLQKR